MIRFLRGAPIRSTVHARIAEALHRTTGNTTTPESASITPTSNR